MAREKRALDEKVEGEKERAEEEEEEAPREASPRQTPNGMKEARGNHTQARLRAWQIKRAGGLKAGKIPAEGGEFILEPEGDFFAATPEVDTAKKKDTIPEESQKTKSWTSSPMKHGTSPHLQRQDGINLPREL